MTFHPRCLSRAPSPNPITASLQHVGFGGAPTFGSWQGSPAKGIYLPNFAHFGRKQLALGRVLAASSPRTPSSVRVAWPGGEEAPEADVSLTSARTRGCVTRTPCLHSAQRFSGSPQPCRAGRAPSCTGRRGNRSEARPLPTTTVCLSISEPQSPGSRLGLFVQRVLWPGDGEHRVLNRLPRGRHLKPVLG